MTFEVDVSDKNPVKFWASVIIAVGTLTGGSGAVSYRLAQEATTDQAQVVAEATAKAAINEHSKQAQKEFQTLEEKIEQNGKQATSISRDVDWIKRTLERIEARQYENRQQ